MRQRKGTPISGERLVKTAKRLAKNMKKAKDDFDKMQYQALIDARNLRINK